MTTKRTDALDDLKETSVTTPIIAVTNQKGGIGKTTTTLGLATVWARQGRRVLVVDADPQHHATRTLGVVPTDQDLTLNDVLVATMAATMAGDPDEGGAAQAVTPAAPEWDGVDVIPADRVLAAREADTTPGRETALRTALAGTTDDYDVVLIDCPPNLGVLTVSALTAATSVLFVTEPRVSSVDGVGELLSTVRLVRRATNPHLSVAGIVINRYRSDRRDRVVWRRTLHEAYPGLMIDHPLPEREVVAVAATNEVPVPRAEARDWTAAIEAVALELLPH